jgi:hypothetical protein
MPDERRRHERVRFPLEVRWEGLSGRHSSRVYDLSLSGCYVESLGQVQPREQIRFEIQSPSGRWLSLTGEVVHAQPNLGFGVRLSDLSESQREALTGLLDYARSTYE